jgi:ComF family protein
MQPDDSKPPVVVREPYASKGARTVLWGGWGRKVLSLPSPGSWLSRLSPLPASRCSVCAAWPAEPVCGACVQRFGRARARCRRCALPVPDAVAECGACLREPPPLDACHAAVDYGYPWSGLLTEFKFHGQPGWAGWFAELLRRQPGVKEAIESCDLVLPLPLARKRLAERGFNQALELARRLAPAAKVQPRLLLRLRETPPQAALGRRERLANVHGAFAVEPLRAAQVRGRRVVLVDDVMTSGASLHAAANALRSAGAGHLTALVVARTEEPA